MKAQMAEALPEVWVTAEEVAALLKEVDDSWAWVKKVGEQAARFYLSGDGNMRGAKIRFHVELMSAEQNPWVLNFGKMEGDPEGIVLCALVRANWPVGPALVEDFGCWVTLVGWQEAALLKEGLFEARQLKPAEQLKTMFERRYKSKKGEVHGA